jgi:demethylmenaquinone methyltransferase / 2-methoxy-6-polyprenyl-1,4-benzoquinol methylase
MAEAKPSPAPTLEVFASIARRYDLANRLMSCGMDVLWRRTAAGLLGAGPHEKVLDIASGTGDLAIADVRYGGAVQVTATDVSEEMMEVGRRKVARKGLSDRIVFSQANGEQLPFADETFDGATVAFGVRNFADRPRAFREIRRVLGPGGRFVCLEFSHPPGRLVRGPYMAYLRHVVPWVGGLVSKDPDSYRYLADSIQAFPDQATVSGMLLEAGFSAVEYRDLTLGIVAVHVARR